MTAGETVGISGTRWCGKMGGNWKSVPPPDDAHRGSLCPHGSIATTSAAPTAAPTTHPKTDTPAASKLTAAGSVITASHRTAIGITTPKPSNPGCHHICVRNVCPGYWAHTGRQAGYDIFLAKKSPSRPEVCCGCPGGSGGSGGRGRLG